MKRNYIDETVRQWLIWSITQSDVTALAFSPTQSDVQLLAIDQILHCTKWDASINSFHHIEFQPISMDIWHMFCWNICLPSQSWWTGWQVLFVKGWGGDREGREKKCTNSAGEFLPMPSTDSTGMPPCMSTFVSHKWLHAPFRRVNILCCSLLIFYW